MDIDESRFKMERDVQAGRALKAAGEMTEALRIFNLVSDPYDPSYEDCDKIHVAAQNLTAAIREKICR